EATHYAQAAQHDVRGEKQRGDKTMVAFQYGRRVRFVESNQDDGEPGALHTHKGAQGKNLGGKVVGFGRIKMPANQLGHMQSPEVALGDAPPLRTGKYVDVLEIMGIER